MQQTRVLKAILSFIVILSCSYLVSSLSWSGGTTTTGSSSGGGEISNASIRAEYYNKTGINATNIKIGNVSDGLLSNNIPKKDKANTFSGANSFSSTTNPVHLQSAYDLAVDNPAFDIFKFGIDSGVNWGGTPFALRWDMSDQSMTFREQTGGGGSPLNINMYNGVALGTFTAAGGSDPPYEHFFNETRETVLARIRTNVPEMYKDGMSIFYNSRLNRWESFNPATCTFYVEAVDLDTKSATYGETYLKAVETIKDGKLCYNNNVEREYYWDEQTGSVKYIEKTSSPKVKLPTNSTINKTTGSIVRK